MYAAEDSEEENRNSFCELAKVLKVTNMIIGCLSPKMVLLRTENRLLLVV